MATEPFRFERRARRPFGLYMVGTALLGLGVLIFGIGAHPVVVTIFALVIAPAVWDVLRDAVAWIEIDDRALRWQSGARGAELPLSEIEEVILSTTLDISQRAKVSTVEGTRMRIPPECLPGGRALDAALAARGVTHRRSLFGF